MTILQKDMAAKILQRGTAGAPGRAAIPPTPGYYTTVTVCTENIYVPRYTRMGEVGEDIFDREGSATAKDITIEGAELNDNSWRVATNEEVAEAFFPGQGPTPCEVAIAIMTALHANRYLYNSIKSIGPSKYIGLAPVGHDRTTGWVALCVINVDRSELPSSVPNPMYKSSGWNFHAELTCSMEGDSVVIEAIP